MFPQVVHAPACPASVERGPGRSRFCAALPLVLSLIACHRAPPPATAPAPPAARSSVLELRSDIDAILASPALDHGYWGILVRSLTADDTLYTLNAGKLMMPASNLKIVTLAAAASRLGWSYSYATRLLGAGGVQDGALQGDLIVVGSGDPTVGHDDPAHAFDTWIESLKGAGIRAIRGRIVGDDNAFDDETLGAGWSWDYLGDGYAAGVSALQFNENVVAVTLAPSGIVGMPATMSFAPHVSGTAVFSDVTTAAAGTAPSIVAHRLPGNPRVDLHGSIPAGTPAVIRTVSVDNPTLFFVDALRDSLIAHGIVVDGPAVDIDELPASPAYADLRPLAVRQSPPLSALAVRMMKASQNLYAETLLKTVGAAAGLPTAAGGRDVVRTTLQSWGIAPSGLVMIDGSGLSRYNLVTPEALVEVLTYVDRDRALRDEFAQALPLAGRDGTAATRMKNTPAENNARIKTGTIANVRTVSGYVKTADGEPLVFSILANNFETPPEVVDRATDAIIVRLSRFRR
jgi:D-alanyl-D-alanine carboxypeptidase/D-alanyl-D-alanine-endopeptidase (penicillin-binding protein 4)